MNTEKILLALGLGGLLYFLSTQAQAQISSDSGSSSGFDFNSLVDSIKNSVEDVVMGNTRGERNNNPGNLRYSVNNPWQGQTGADSAGFAVFDTPENGLRAMFITLKNQIARGLNTLSLLIPTYSATAQAAYIANVSAWAGIGADTPFDASFVPVLAPAMIRMENGNMPYTSNQLAYAASAAGVG